MSIRILKQKQLNELYENIDVNLDEYLHGDFKEYINNEEFTHQHDGQSFNVDKLNSISGGRDDDAKNARIIFDALEGLSPFLAKDMRFWAYLSHTYLFEYVKERWPIKEEWTREQKLHHIRTHYFVLNKSYDREIERDNAVSRLWWTAFIAKKMPKIEFSEAINMLFRDLDVLSSMFGRPSLSTNKNLLFSVMNRMNESQNNDRALIKNRIYRNFFKDINIFGGSRIIPAMSDYNLDKALDGMQQKIIGNPDSNDLETQLIAFRDNVINKEVLNEVAEENQILNDYRMIRFVAYKPISVEDYALHFDLGIREGVDSSHNDYLKDILKIIDKYVEEND